MDRDELIIKALETYRETVLQNNVIDMALAEYSNGAWDRRDIYNLAKQYASIDRIIKALRECKDLMRKFSGMRLEDETDGEITTKEYNEIVSQDNALYFKLMDIIG